MGSALITSRSSRVDKRPVLTNADRRGLHRGTGHYGAGDRSIPLVRRNHPQPSTISDCWTRRVTAWADCVTRCSGGLGTRSKGEEQERSYCCRSQTSAAGAYRLPSCELQQTGLGTRLFFELSWLHPPS